MQRSFRRGIAFAAIAMPLALAGDTAPMRDTVLDVPGVPVAVVAADVDRNGSADLIVLLAAGAPSSPLPPLPSLPRLALLRNLGNGRFAAATALPDLTAAPDAPLGAIAQVIAVDLDRDGDLDLVGVGFPSAVWRNVGDGTFGAEALPPDADGDHIAAGDLDGDAAPDLVVARDEEPSVLRVLRNDGAGRFAPMGAVMAEAAWPLQHLAVADANGDSVLDVVATGAAPGAATVLRGLGGGAFAFPEPLIERALALAPFGTTGRFAVADFDGDHRDDLAAAVAHPRAGVSVMFASDTSGELMAPTPAANDAATDSVASPLVIVRGRIFDRPNAGGDRVLLTGEIPDAALASIGRFGVLDVEIRTGDTTLVASPKADGPAPGTASGVRATIDIARRRFTVAATALEFAAPPSNPVTVTLVTPAGRWRHVAAWRAPRRGELSWVSERARSAATPAAPGVSTDAAGATAAFTVTTRRIGDDDVQVLRDRATGREWRFDKATGQWVPLPPDRTPETDALDVTLAAYLPLDRDFGDVVRGADRAAVSRGGVTIGNGEARFDGTGWLELPHIPLNGRAHAFSMWIRPEGTTDVMGLVEQRAANADGRHYHLMLRGHLQPYLGFYNNDLSAQDGVARNEWHHVVFQYTGTAQEIWVDGARVATRATSAYAGTTGATSIGKNPGWSNVGGSHFVGAMRGVRAYTRSVTADEVAALFRSERPPEARPPVGTTLTFEGVIDGSDRVVITAKEARWENVYWGTFDTEVKLNGIAWRPRSAPVLANDGETRFLPKGIDLSRARLVERSGRDHVSIETEPGRLILRFVDSPNGVDTYRVVVEIP